MQHVRIGTKSLHRSSFCYKSQPYMPQYSRVPGFLGAVEFAQNATIFDWNAWNFNGSTPCFVVVSSISSLNCLLPPTMFNYSATKPWHSTSQRLMPSRNLPRRRDEWDTLSRLVRAYSSNLTQDKTRLEPVDQPIETEPENATGSVNWKPSVNRKKYNRSSDETMIMK